MSFIACESSVLDKSSVGCMYRIPIPRSPQLESESCSFARPVVNLTDTGNSELLLCLDGGIDKGGMGESSSKSVSSSQSIACSSESTEISKQSPSLSMVSSPNIPLNSTSNTCGKTKVKLTLQDYRKQVGIRVLNLKPNQKIGISAKSESPLEAETQPSPSKPQPTALSPCPHCGYSNTCSTNKCQRCMRVFDKVKTEDSLDPFPESNFTGISQMSKEPCNYGNRRPRVQSSQLSRQTRAKFEEPQCVTLSSDEDEDSFQESKRRKSGDLIPLPEHSIPSVSDSMQLTSYEAVDSSNCEKNSPVEEKKGEGLKDLDRWKDGGLKGSFFAVNCRSVRIGSYKFNPTGRVLFSTEGIMLEAPVANSSDESTSRKWINVAILSEHLLQVQVNFNRQLPVIFLHVSPAVCRMFSSQLGLCKSSGPYWDIASTDESQKRLTLLPCSLDDSAKNAIKQAFVPKGVFIEINNAEANRLLVISSPLEVRVALDRVPVTTAVSAESTTSVSSKTNTASKESKENVCKIEKRQTRGASKSASRQSLLPVVPMFSWSDGPDRFSVTTEDYSCLDQDNLLNDSIIDFYVRYVFSTELDESVKSKCHVFSSFFYQRLTTRPPKLSGRKHPIEDDPSLTLKEKRHSRVQSWTKKVDIFEKDYLVIPINERAHWFLAIVCFPGLPGPVSVKDGKPIKLHPLKRLLKKTPSKSLNKLVTVAGESFHIGNTTITPINSNGKSTKIIPVTLSVDTDRDEAETDEEDVLSQLNSSHSVIEKSSEITEPIKQPCILFFDSLAGSSHYRVAATLREYLMVEYEKRRKPLEDSRDNENEHITKTTSELFSKETMISACLDVPQQNNSFDCGIYVLQYAESFMKNPFVDYNLPNLNLTNWFSSCVAGKKRKAIQLLLTQLTKETNPQADSVLELLPKEDVEDVENVVSESNSEVSPTDDDVDFQDTITIKNDA